MSKPTPVGRYIDLYRELCGTTPTLNNQECEVITRLVAETHSPEDMQRDAERYRWLKRAHVDVMDEILAQEAVEWDSLIDIQIAFDGLSTPQQGKE